MSDSNRKVPGSSTGKEFREFVLRGNVVDLAVGVIIATAFGAVVTALVTNVIMPLTTIPMKNAPKFEDLKATVGGATIEYGKFLAALVSFLVISLVVFFCIVKPVAHLMSKRRTEPELDETTKECTECLSSIPKAARRCAFCTAQQTTAV